MRRHRQRTKPAPPRQRFPQRLRAAPMLRPTQARKVQQASHRQVERQQPNRPPQVRQQVRCQQLNRPPQARLPRVRGMRRAIHPQPNCPPQVCRPQVPQARLPVVRRVGRARTPLSIPRLVQLRLARARGVSRRAPGGGTPASHRPPQVRPRRCSQCRLRPAQVRGVRHASSPQLNRPPQVRRPQVPQVRPRLVRLRPM